MNSPSDPGFPSWARSAFVHLFFRVDNAMLWHWNLASDTIAISSCTDSGSYLQLNSWESVLEDTELSRLHRSVATAIENNHGDFSLTCNASFPGKPSIPMSCHGAIINREDVDGGGLHLLGFFRELRHGAKALHGGAELPPDAAQTRVLANMSHEIRTPLNGILGMVELALDSKPTQELHHYLQGIRSSSMALLRVLNDILDYSKSASGFTTFESNRFLLRHLVGEVLDLFAADADRKGLEFICVIAPALPDEIIGDSFRIRQILLNIVGNAIKFTHSGHVTLRVEGRCQSSAVLEVQFIVEDTGIGIPDDRIESVFIPFVQIDSSTTRNFGGTGLGLSICKALADGMGGKISAQSKLGKGSLFRLVLPLKVFTAPCTIRVAKELASRRILVSLSSLVNAIALERILNGLGHHTITCTTIEETDHEFERANKNNDPFDVWVLDGQFAAQENGAVFHRFQHNEKILPGTLQRCILISTPLRYSSDSTLCDTYGIRTRLRSPWLDTSVRDAIRTVAGPGTSAADEPKPAPLEDQEISVDLQLIEEALAPMPEKKALILLVDDDPMNLQVLQRILERAGFDVETAENGEQALEAFGNGAFDAIIMDVQMPVMDGIAATEAIRLKELRRSWVTTPWRKSTPVIGLTADVHTSIKAAAIEAGMDDVLVKPISRQALIEKILEYIDHSYRLYCDTSIRAATSATG